MVAPSFQNLMIVSDPYKENGRAYVSVKNPATNKVRKVRWYTEDEFRRAFPAAKVETENKIGMQKQNIALGFHKGYVHLFKGEFTEDNLDWFKLNKEICYNVVFGWFLPSNYELPKGMPEGFELVKLDWDRIAATPETMVAPDKAKEVVNELLYPASPSQYQGEIGSSITARLTVYNRTSKDTIYGLQHTHFFKDADDNVYAWSTTAKCLTIGQTYDVRGQVKAHTSYKNIKTTWLTRCRTSC